QTRAIVESPWRGVAGDRAHPRDGETSASPGDQESPSPDPLRLKTYIHAFLARILQPLDLHAVAGTMYLVGVKVGWYASTSGCVARPGNRWCNREKLKSRPATRRRDG